MLPIESSTNCASISAIIDKCRYDVIPDIIRATHELALYLLRKCFFVIPLVAFGSGLHKDAALSFAVGIVSGIEKTYKNRQFRDMACLIVGIPVAVRLALHICSTNNLAGIAIQGICLAKLIVIGKGKNR